MKRILFIGVALLLLLLGLRGWVYDDWHLLLELGQVMVLVGILIAAVLRMRKSSVLPDSADIDWLFETLEWLARALPEYGMPNKQQLFLPTEEDFPIQGLEGEALAKALFRRTRRLAGVARLPCRLKAQSKSDLLVGFAIAAHESNGAAGTFCDSEDAPPVIRYDPSLLQRPRALVAVFAHELSHLLIHRAPESPPGRHKVNGDLLEEAATDLCAVYLGFGVFLAESAFSYQRDSQGWEARWQGYLSPTVLSVALAIMVLTLDLSPQKASPHLSANPRTCFEQALRVLPKEHSVQLERLRYLFGVADSRALLPIIADLRSNQEKSELL